MVIAGQSWQRVILDVPVELNGDCRKGQSWQRVILYVPVELNGDCRNVELLDVAIVRIRNYVY